MGQTSLSLENFEKLSLFIEQHSGATDGLMPILHEAQDIFGYIPLEVQKFISTKNRYFSCKNSWSCDILFSIFNRTQR